MPFFNQIFTAWLVAAVAGSRAPSTDVATEPQSDGIFDACWDDAFSEAAYALLAFSSAAVVIQAMKSRSKKAPTRKLAAPKATTKPSPPGDGASSCSASRPTFAAAQDRLTQRKSPDYRPGATSTQRAQQQGRSESDVIVAAVRAGRAPELPELLDAAQRRAAENGVAGVALEKECAMHVLSALRSCASRHNFREALAAYDHVADRIGEGCDSTWSLLLYSAVEAKQFSRCDGIIAKLLQCAVPSSNDFVNMVRYHARHWQDVQSLQATLAEMRRLGFVPNVITRNRALSVCVTEQAIGLAEVLASEDVVGTPMDVIGYNTLMKGFSQAGDLNRCFEIHKKSMAMGLEPSEMTYGILLDACFAAKDLENAKRVFGDLRASGLKTNVVHYTTYMKGLATAGWLDEASAVLEEMASNPETQPDLVTYSTLVKANADSGKVMAAIGLLERLLDQGITADAIIFNTVLTGCCVNPMEPKQVFHVFRWLAKHGLETSNTTLSILIKALGKTRSWSLALELLETAHERFGVWPESRLYTQLAQACSRAGDGKDVVATYISAVQAMASRGIPVDEALNSRFFRFCNACGEVEAAARISKVVILAGGYVAPEAANTLLAGEGPEASRISQTVPSLSKADANGNWRA